MTRLWEVRPRWRTETLGEFFCPGCGGDRNYRRQQGRRWARVLGIPLVPAGGPAVAVQCTACRGRYGTDVLEVPTTARLSRTVRDAQYTVALAVLAAGGTGSRPAREAACALVRDAGFEDCGEAQVLAALAALWGGPDGSFDVHGHGSGLAVELHAALELAAAHLAAPGLERLLLQGARIALADGPYRPAERDVLMTAGRCLRLPDGRVGELLETAAGTPH